MNLLVPPDPLSSRQRTIVAIAALVCAASRFLAMARSVWEWDEALFTIAMRDYDVTLHSPHPPGFPVYIAMAKLARLVVGDDFRALQSVNLIAALLVFPAVFLLARELRMRFPTALIAATLFAFFPNVWLFGGGAFSDIPSIVLVVLAVVCLLRGARDRNAYWIGTFLLALAIGIRPQNLLVGLVPGLLATRRRKPAEIAFAALIGVVVVGTAFGGAIAASRSFDDYVRVVREHGEYIAKVDSWRSPLRPPMWRLSDRFFVKQYQSPVLSFAATLLVLVSIVGSIRERSRSMLINVLTFAPFAIVAWAMLDRYSISRFSIGYQPMFALFVADGIRRVGARRARLEPAIAGALTLAFIVYAFPALTPVRREIAPSILAARAAAARVDPNRQQLFVGHTMSKFVDLVAPGFPYTRVLDDRAIPLTAPPDAWLLAEITDTGEEGFVFRRERGHLWNIARRHYFEIKLAPLRTRARFVSGWYDPDSADIHEWRWMEGRSVTQLPPALGETKLSLQFELPAELVAQKPRVTVELNGRVLETFEAGNASPERDYRVMPAARGLPNVLVLSVDRTVVAGGDARALGLRLRYLSWGKS